MNTLGKRLKHSRINKNFTQESLAETIGVSRGVIFNIEKSKAKPQLIVINAICQTLNINKDWLVHGVGAMEDTTKTNQSTKALAELYEVVKGLSEDEQLYLLDIIKALKTRLASK